jgi:tryptophanyl-tRNA synthetase
MSKKRIFSGVKPSGAMHLGNYLGAISQWVDMQERYECIFCVVDYHAITVKQDPALLGGNVIDIAKIYLASGIDPAKSIIFQQSDISAHTELAWILNCASARISDLKKMTQFKDKAGNNQENVSVGLFDYPVLMAADILLYDTELVPVGDDQKQHVELARDLAKRFNHHFGEAFVIPDVKIKKEGARIMGLDNPEKKMSKSAPSESNYIALGDSPEKAAKKIMRAVTDTEKEIKFDLEKKPAISNLLNIYSLLSGQKIKDIEKAFIGKGYGDFKKELAEIVIKFLSEFQARVNGISDDDVKKILDEGAKKAEPIANKTLKKVKEKIGINIVQ